MKNDLFILIDGYLVTNPSSKYDKDNKLISSFRIACNKFAISNGKCGEENMYFSYIISYFRVIMYERLAEICVQYLRKGNGVRVIGKLKQDSCKTVSKAKKLRIVIADSIKFKPELNKDKK